MGDGVLAYFGYPQAHEDDAERAVRAGLALVEAVAELETPPAIRLQARIGIATGLVVVGDLIGAGAAQEQAVVGETPNLAARLQALAEPDAVVIADEHAAAARRPFRVPRPRRRRGSKGFAEPVHAWQVLRRERASRAGSRRCTRPALTPLVGREEEIELLLRRWQRAKTGEGQVVLLSGEPGIGKSRLAAALQRAARRRAAHPLALFLLAAPHGQRALIRSSRSSNARPGSSATTRPRRSSTSWRRCSPGTDAARGRGAARRAAVAADGDRYPAARTSRRSARRRDLRGAVWPARGLARQQPVLMIFEDVALDRPQLARAARPPDRARVERCRCC